VIALPCLLYSMDLTVLYLAVPSLSAALRPTATELLWIVDIYGFLLAGSLITMGTLGDRIGRRRLLLTGAAAFGGASVLAAFSTSALMLIAARALLGVAAATLAPSTLSLIRNMFLDPKQRTTAIAVWAASFSAGAAIGPPIGGLLLSHFWWGSVFLLAVPTMALLLVLGPLLLPEYRAPQPGRLDVASAGMSIAAVLAVIFGLKDIARTGIGGLPVVSILVGLVLGIGFVRRQRVLADPLIDLRLFRTRTFSLPLVANTLSLFAAFGASLFVAQYLQLVLGLSPFVAGWWTVPEAGGLIVGSMLAPLVVRRLSPAFAMAAGMVLAGVGFGILIGASSSAGLAFVVIGSVVYSLGIAPVVTLATDMIVGAAPPDRAGTASGLSESSTEFGGALGIAVLGSIGTAVYRTQVAGTIPAGLPPDVRRAALDTLGGAVGAARPLPPDLEEALIHSAREAFVVGLHVAAVVCVAVSICLAVLLAVLLKDGADPLPATPPGGPA
jgi:MFS transporter, DHA2 family, multidrug resistance protein